jgi:hypothetical protein
MLIVSPWLIDGGVSKGQSANPPAAAQYWSPLQRTFYAAVQTGQAVSRAACSGGRTANLLADETGFALAWRPAGGGPAGTTGGTNYQTFTVQNLRDTDATHPNGVPGSLRAAVTAAAAAGGGWIVFDPVKNSSIILNKTLYLPSNITIDGGCQHIKITSNILCFNKNNQLTKICTDETCVNCSPSLFAIVNATNVVITNLTFSPDQSDIFAYDTKINPATGLAFGLYESGDCITVSSNSPSTPVNGIWIAHNSFTGCHDGLIDITQNNYDFANPQNFKPTQITVAFNYFFGFHDKDSGVGTGACEAFNRQTNTPAYCTLDPAGHSATLRPWDPNNGIQLTLQGNLFSTTGARHPHTSGVAYVDMVDNIIGYKKVGYLTTDNSVTLTGNTIFTETYGTYVGGGSRVHGNNNMYFSLMPTGNAYYAVGTATSTKSTNDGGGATQMANTFVLPAGTPFDTMRNPQLVGTPTMAAGQAYAAITPMLDFGNPWVAVTCLAAHVGAGSSFPPSSDPCPAGSY